MDFGKYDLIEKIGTGGMAEVYLAKSYGAEGLEKTLVIKKILPEFSQNPRFIDMFISEAKIAVHLNHPNIVQIYDFGKVDDDYYLAMEYVDGHDLGQIISACRRASRPLSIGDAIFVAIELAKGLHYAHERPDEYGEPLSIVHRDISPQNVLVSQDGTVKIVDFGIAKATSVAEENPEVVKGKFSYMSPEQASGGEVDHRSDLFSLGVVLFEMVCGRPLFKQTTQEETLSLVKSAVVPDISSLNDAVPPQLEHLLYKLLAREPDERHQSARELQVELTRVLYGLGDIHDSITLSNHLSEVEASVDAVGGAAGGGGRTAMTSVLKTASPTTAGAGTTASSGTAVVRTPTGGRTMVAEEGGQSARFLARERKEVVIIAGEVMGLLELRSAAADQARWLQVLQEYTRIVDSIAFKNEGVVHRVNENGFVIVLGVPVSSENDAERAARVAMDLQDAVAGMSLSLESPLQLAMGAAVGEVLIEQEVGHGRGEYHWSFFGDSHTVAEKLAAAAMAKELLLGGQVYRRIRRDYDCDKIDEVRFADDDDGSTKSLLAWRLVGRKSPEDQLQEVRRSYHSFYGREIPLRVLRNTYRDTLLRGQVSGFILVGEQGVGKSTLVEEFLGGLDARNVRVLRGVITPFDRDVPLGCMANLMAEMMRLGPRDDLRQLRDTLRTRVEALFPEVDRRELELLLHSIGSIFSIKYAGGEFRELDGEERRTRTFLSLNKVLTRFAEKKPMVLAIEDIHNLDSVTLEFATRFLDSRRHVPALLLATAQHTGSHTRSEQWQQLLGARNVTVEDLGEMNPQSARSLIRDLLRVHRIFDEDLVEEIWRRSGGNPLFIKEVIEVLRDRGLLKDSDDRRQLKVLDEDPQWLPASVEGLISARIDRLPIASRVVLQKVSLLWSPFSVDDARLVLEDDPVEALEELVELGFVERADVREDVRQDGAEPDEVAVADRLYRFRNALIGEVASRSVLPEEAERLHRLVADYLRERAGEEGVSDLARIGRHLDGAGETDEAVAYYFAAAQQAFRDFGAAECLRLCDKVVERASPDDEEYFQALILRERAYHELGSADEQRAVLDDLHQLAFERRGPDDQIEVLLRESRFAFEESDFKESRSFVRRAHELADAHESALGRAHAWRDEARLLITEGHRDEAHDMLQKAIAIYEHHDDEIEALEGLADCHNARGVILRQAGRHDDALEAYDIAIAYARRGDLGKQRRLLMMNSALALVYVGKLSEALERYQSVLEECQRLGHRRDEASVLVNYGHAFFLLGEVETAIGHIRRGIYLARKTGSTSFIADGQISLGYCYLAQGDLEAADQSLHEGLRIADSIPNVYLSIHATLALAQVRLAAGTADDARIALIQAEDGLERSQAVDMTWGVAYASSLMARALKILGRRDEAIARSSEAVEYLDEGSSFAFEEILYVHTQILPDEAQWADERVDAITRARDHVLGRRDLLADDEQRRSFMARDIHRRIMQAASLLIE